MILNTGRFQMTDEDKLKIETIKLEYASLKAEQLKRIEHRDHIVYLQLVVVGLLLGLIAEVGLDIVVYAIPFSCIALGWLYLVNDQKVSAIGKYIRHDLSNAIERYLEKGSNVFGWEVGHRSDERRFQRKLLQFFIDIFVFIAPGVVAILLAYLNHDTKLEKIVLSIEFAFLLILFFQILAYADFKVGK